MILQSIISQSSLNNQYEEQPSVTWTAATSGNYNTLDGVTTVDIFTPVSSGVDTYNHHPFAFEYYSAIHVIFSTHNQDEEGPGQYVRYSKSTDNGSTWSAPTTLIESQDDITNSYVTDGGRVCLPSGFAVYNSELYAIVDVNDRSSTNTADPRTRTGVGVLARKINSNGTFGTVYWIENVDGTFTAPTAISGYPSYDFNLTLRGHLRAYIFNNPTARPAWYYSVPISDKLRSRSTYGADEISEPSVTTLPNGQILSLWRWLSASADVCIAETSSNNIDFNDAYETEIPDHPSKTEIITFSNNVVGVIGNADNGNRTPLFLSLSVNGYSYDTDNTYDIDTSTDPASFSGFGKGIGVQYPDAIQLANGKCFVVYSVTKEGIRCASFDVPSLV